MVTCQNGVFYTALCAILFALCFSVDAQQPKNHYRIGYLSNSDPATESVRSEPIRLALRSFGYIEGQNLAIAHFELPDLSSCFPLLLLTTNIVVSDLQCSFSVLRESRGSISITGHSKVRAKL